MSVPHQPQRLTSPWRPEDLVRLTVLGVVGLSGIAMAWYGVSGQGRLSQQMSWLNLAVLALVLAGAANVAWLTAGRRAVGIRRNELLARWDIPVEQYIQRALEFAEYVYLLDRDTIAFTGEPGELDGDAIAATYIGTPVG